MPSTSRCAGCPAGAATASTTWWPTGRTGASRASAPGACRFRRSTAPRAARRSSRRSSSTAPPASSTPTAPTPGTSVRSKSSCPKGLPCPACGGTASSARRDILDVWFDSGSSHEAVLPFRPELTLAGGHLPRGQRPAPRLVPELAARRPRHARPAAVPRSGHPRLHRRRGRPQDVQVARQLDRARGHHQGERRRDPPAVGHDGRLPGGSPARQANPGARGRGLPQDPEHLPLPARNLYDFDPAADQVPRRDDAGGRPLRARALRGGRALRCSTPTRTTTSRRSSSA